VKTYPLPSPKLREVVCTAGVTESGDFIRLRDVDFRYRLHSEQFKKYQWIEVPVTKRTDKRPETFRPAGRIKILNDKPITDWVTRKQYVLKRAPNTMCWLEKRDQSEVSLGIVRVKTVRRFVATPGKQNWKNSWLNVMKQLDIFGQDPKPLEKVPYDFSYEFICEEDGCRGHTKTIHDWEIMALYLKMRDKYGEEKAIQKVKERFFNVICSPDRDTHFFVGTVLRHGTWIILGTFWPKKNRQMRFESLS
jgi:hypothetical protein